MSTLSVTMEMTEERPSERCSLLKSYNEVEVPLSDVLLVVLVRKSLDLDNLEDEVGRFHFLGASTLYNCPDGIPRQGLG